MKIEKVTIMKDFLIVLSLLSLLFCGCAERIWIYDKPGCGDLELSRDSDECKGEANEKAVQEATGNPMYNSAMAFRSLALSHYDRCMEAKGWRIVGSKKVPGSIGF